MEDAILITNAYKRVTVVILDVKDYVEECERQINNTENYNRLQNGTTGANNELVKPKNYSAKVSQKDSK